VVVINGPTVVIHRPDFTGADVTSACIIYSVQLANGLVVTSPDKFPVSVPQQETPSRTIP